MQPTEATSARPRAFGMKTALVLSLLMMTTTGCILPAKLLQALRSASRPEPDITRYPKTILRGIVPGQKIDWIGNDTVVFAGWGVKNQPGTSLYAWDLRNPPERIFKKASNFCVNGNSVMLSVREPKAELAKNYRIQFPSRTVDYLGTMEISKGLSYSSRHTCEIRTTPEPLIGHFWDELEQGNGYLDFGPLDGSLKGYAITRLDKNLTNRQETGIKIDLPILIHLTDWHPQPGHLLYDINLSPEERERWQRTNRLTVWHLDEQHRGHALNVPAGPWVNTHRGDILFLKARDALVITTKGFAPDGSPGTAGIYLVQPDGRYQRLETGFVSTPALSADGCRLAYAFEKYNDHRSQPHAGGRILVVANLCAERTER